jgi:hypothetical protein
MRKKNRKSENGAGLKRKSVDVLSERRKKPSWTRKISTLSERPTLNGSERLLHRYVLVQKRARALTDCYPSPNSSASSVATETMATSAESAVLRRSSLMTRSWIRAVTSIADQITIE